MLKLFPQHSLAVMKRYYTSVRPKSTDNLSISNPLSTKKGRSNEWTITYNTTSNPTVINIFTTTKVGLNTSIRFQLRPQNYSDIRGRLLLRRLVGTCKSLVRGGKIQRRFMAKVLTLQNNILYLYSVRVKRF